MRTLNASWIAAVTRSDAEIRYLVTITDGATTWQAVSGKCSQIRLPSAVETVAPFSAQLDVVKREVKIGEIDLTVRASWIRPVLINNRMNGMKLTIEIGEASLSEANFETYFTGYIADHIPDEGYQTVVIETVGSLHFLKEAEIVGAWFNLHPLEAAENIIATKVSVHSSLYDSTSLDPDTDTVISHYVVGRGDLAGHVSDGTVRNPENAFKLLNEIAVILRGAFFEDESGKISFKRFDSAAASSADWGVNDISPIKPLGRKVFNQVDCNGRFGGGHFRTTFTLKDSDSQTNYAFPSASTRILSHRVESKWDNFWTYAKTDGADLISGWTAAQTALCAIQSMAIMNMSGMRDIAGSPPAAAAISAARPLWLVSSEGEIIKATGVTSGTYDPKIVVNTRNPEEPEVSTDTSKGYRLLSGVTRDADSALGGGVALDGSVPQLFDITILYDYATEFLDRFGDGADVIEVKTDLSQFAVEITDLVTITDPDYCSYTHDGLSTSTKWEVVGKDVVFEGGGGGITWTLVEAPAHGGTTATARRMGDTFLRDIEYTAARQSDSESIFQNHIKDGLSVQQTAGLAGSIARGVISSGVITKDTYADVANTFTASKDTYVFADTATGAISFWETALGAGQPKQSRTSVRVAKVVTDGSAITSIDQDSGVNRWAIAARAISSETNPTDGSLVVNGSFSGASRK